MLPGVAETHQWLSHLLPCFFFAGQPVREYVEYGFQEFKRERDSFMSSYFLECTYAYADECIHFSK